MVGEFAGDGRVSSSRSSVKKITLLRVIDSRRSRCQFLPIYACVSGIFP